MRINVDLALCQNYGQCVFAAPDVFDLDDAGELVHQASADESARADVEAAAMACPVQAITIEG
ncbi:ferredoxin [Prauserella flavalba]|uniref:Ferredoxin n=1 Tax=Prauserella flavalba TaxID=1477506 RepID=A0A318M214_9PSEU|nr:ferredoxin [Prauserella flavalba]PXY36575.1 ferredoxin [Prauserella flavalba]